MIRRDFMKSAIVLGSASGNSLSLHASPSFLPKKSREKKYRAGVVGLGWMGVLYDMGKRDYENIRGSYKEPKYNLESSSRPTPDWLDIHRKFYHHEHPGKEGLIATYAEALWDRPEVDLVAGADRDKNRLAMFGERYSITALYTDALEMYHKEKLDIVAIATNTKGRSFLTIKAVEAQVKGILTDKPMTFTLKEADDMVKVCADSDVPLVGGATTTSHPSFGKAKELIRNGIIGNLISIEARLPSSQHQNWSYFVDSDLAWVSGIGDKPRRESGSTEFMGQGIIVAKDGTVVHIRNGAPSFRASGHKGEISFDGKQWRLWQNINSPSGPQGRVEMPWPDPKFGTMRTVWCLDDLIASMEGRMDEPKNSGRRVAMALEAELGMKQSSAQGGKQIKLPLKDRSLGLTYDWFR